MDYSYLNQAAAAAAAAGFEASSCALASDMQCGYGDLSSCSQMSQAAYRYRAAASYSHASSGTTSASPGSAIAAHHTGHSHHPAHTTPCSVMAARSQDVVHRHAASLFNQSINLQGIIA